MHDKWNRYWELSIIESKDVLAAAENLIEVICSKVSYRMARKHLETHVIRIIDRPGIQTWETA